MGCLQRIKVHHRTCDGGTWSATFINIQEILRSDYETKFIFVTGGVLSRWVKDWRQHQFQPYWSAAGWKLQIKSWILISMLIPEQWALFNMAKFLYDDGAETDLDLGHYERFSSTCMESVTTSPPTSLLFRYYQRKTRRLFRQTVQVIPHITNEIKDYIRKTASGFDVSIVEIGGTVGDIESLPFLEAIRNSVMKQAGKTPSSFIWPGCLLLKPQEKLKPSPRSIALRHCAKLVFSRTYFFAGQKISFPKISSLDCSFL